MLAAVGDLAVARPQDSDFRESGPIHFGADGGSAVDEDDPLGRRVSQVVGLWPCTPPPPWDPRESR
jgi:hypothetical protein